MSPCFAIPCIGPVSSHVYITIFFAEDDNQHHSMVSKRLHLVYKVEITPTDVDLKGVGLMVGHVTKEKSKGGILEIYHKIIIQHCVAF